MRQVGAQLAVQREDAAQGAQLVERRSAMLLQRQRVMCEAGGADAGDVVAIVLRGGDVHVVARVARRQRQWQAMREEEARDVDQVKQARCHDPGSSS